MKLKHHLVLTRHCRCRENGLTMNRVLSRRSRRVSQWTVQSVRDSHVALIRVRKSECHIRAHVESGRLSHGDRGCPWPRARLVVYVHVLIDADRPENYIQMNHQMFWTCVSVPGILHSLQLHLCSVLNKKKIVSIRVAKMNLEDFQRSWMPKGVYLTNNLDISCVNLKYVFVQTALL